MKSQQYEFMLLLGRPPVRLTYEQAAWVLNCQPYDLAVLVAARVLKPLGNPMPNSVKYFATAEMLELAKDTSWLAKVTNTEPTLAHEELAKERPAGRRIGNNQPLG